MWRWNQGCTPEETAEIARWIGMDKPGRFMAQAYVTDDEDRRALVVFLPKLELLDVSIGNILKGGEDHKDDQ